MVGRHLDQTQHHVENPIAKQSGPPQAGRFFFRHLFSGPIPALHPGAAILSAREKTMQISTNLSTVWPETTGTPREVKRTRDISTVTEAPQKDVGSQIEGSPFPVQKELTPEEKQRVEFLQNLLAQTMAMAEGNPTDEQKTRIREIENELEKITGIKNHSRLSTMTAKMPGKTDKEEEEEREKKYQTEGIDPKVADHFNRSDMAPGENPGMQMLRQNALFNSIGALDLSGLSSLSS
jgi:hypothetical protein